MVVGRIVYWFTIALVFALFEVEVEGKFGWSEKSQTWHLSGQKVPNVLRLFLGEKPLTGYHIFVFLSAFLISHMHFLWEQFGIGIWNWHLELATLATYLTWTPTWDYLWLLFNPSYGVRKLGSNDIWWYKNSYWVLGVIPIENIVQWGLSILISVAGGFWSDQLIFMAGLGILTVVSVSTLAPLYARWNHRMHQMTLG